MAGLREPGACRRRSAVARLLPAAGILALALAAGAGGRAMARAAEWVNPFDYPDPLSGASTPTPAIPSETMPRIRETGIGANAMPSPMGAIAPISAFPGVRVPVAAPAPGDAGAAFQLRYEEMRALAILLQREIAAGRADEEPFRHAGNLYRRLYDCLLSAVAGSPADAAAPPSGAAPAAAAPPALAAVDPREAIRNGLAARLTRGQAVDHRAARQDLAFFEIFLGHADRAFDAWEAAGPESDGDLRFPLVRALLNLSLLRYEDGAADLEQALRLLDLHRGFRLLHAGFVTELRGFRDFTPRADRRFQPKEEYALYVELDRAAFQPVDDEYAVDVDIALSLADSQGEVRWRERGLGVFAQRYRAPVRDLHLLVEDRLPDLPPGFYTLSLHARDRHTLQQATIGVAIEVVGGARPAPGSASALAAARREAGDAKAFGEAKSPERVSAFDRYPPSRESYAAMAAPSPPPARPAPRQTSGVDDDMFGIGDPEGGCAGAPAPAAPVVPAAPTEPLAPAPPSRPAPAASAPGISGERRLAAREEELRRRERDLARRENELRRWQGAAPAATPPEADMDEAARDLAWKDKQLTMIEEDLRRRERGLDRREDELGRREDDLRRRRESDERAREQRDRVMQQSMRGMSPLYAP